MLNFIKNNLKWILGTVLCLALLLYGFFAPETTVPFFEEEALITDEPDAFIIDGVYTSYRQDGKLESVLRSTLAKHYPKTDTGRLENPNLELYQNGELRWTTTSNKGEFDVIEDTLVLTGNVTVFGETEGGIPFTMKTDSLNYANKSSFIETDKPVRIVSQSGDISGVGMKANIQNRTIKLLSQVKGNYEP